MSAFAFSARLPDERGRIVNISLTYNKPTTSAVGYLEWIEVEIPCTIALMNGQTRFRNPSTVGSGNVTRFNLSGVPTSATVWDVTRPSQTVRRALSSINAILGTDLLDPEAILHNIFAKHCIGK